MVREARLAYLEAKVEQTNRVHERPFKLAGSLKTYLSEDAIEQVFRELRKGWSARTTE